MTVRIATARSASRRSAALYLALALLPGCGGSRPAPPRAPVLAAPVDAVPPDLDLVLRVDLAKVRSALGPTGLASLRGEAGEAIAETRQELVARALEATDTAILALRPELLPHETDNVLVLAGHFGELGVDRALRASGYSAPVDLGADVRRFDRAGKVSRSSPARVYAFSNERLVFVSAAEIDSVEAVLERHRAPSSVKPQSRGVLAFAARLRTLGTTLVDRYPELAEAIGPATAVQGVLDATPTGLGLEVALEMPTEASAERTADALGRIRQALGATTGKMASMAQNANIQAVGHFAVVRVALERGIL